MEYLYYLITSNLITGLYMTHFADRLAGHNPPCSYRVQSETLGTLRLPNITNRDEALLYFDTLYIAVPHTTIELYENNILIQKHPLTLKHRDGHTFTYYKTVPILTFED